VVILRYGALLFLVGAAALALVQQIGTSVSPGSVSALLLSCALLIIALALPLLKYLATTVKLSAQFNKLKAKGEKWHRLWLDLVAFTMVVSLAAGILIIALTRRSPRLAFTHFWPLSRTA
jgi:hypothetical protein